MKLIFLAIAVFNLINAETICNFNVKFHCDFTPWNLGFEFFEKDLISSHVGYEYEYQKQKYKNFDKNVTFDVWFDGLTTHYEINLLIEHTCTKSKKKYIYYWKEITFSWFDEFYNGTIDLNLTDQGDEFVPWYKRILSVGEGNQTPP
ncbi:unnamed protein product [Caenorhabditis angaria]|uniref:Uncharacterized protein n=1 Tax=Caenorhabditis angaria TaxID=860376 RepID=A0A9P1IKC8_9PELO|nr:unnamed protein product [Caenorhabditis angaria]